MGSIQVSKRLLSSLLVLSTLTACGGGGTTNGNNDDDGNTIPTAQDVTTTTPEDTPKLVTLDATDSDGDTLTYIKVTDPAHGTLSIQNNILTYTPDTNYNGSDSFTYKINDGTGDSNIATASITIEATNDIPTANTQSVTTAEDTTKAITLTGSDPDNDSLSYIKVTDPSNGTVSFSGATATYTPNANYNGSDSFTYKVNDGTVDSAVATVSISVGAANDAPTANAQSVTTAEDTTKAITLTGSDPDNDSLSYIKVTDPSNGTVSFNGATATYTPNENYNGSDSFTYKVNDGTVDSSTATVSITINAVNDAPIAGGLGISETFDEDTSKTFNLPGYDPDGAPLAVLTGNIVTQPEHGTITVNNKQATYTPDSNYNGLDSFTYTLTDEQGAVSNQQDFTLNITAVNDAPIANAGTDASVIEGETLTLNGSGSSDIDNDLLNHSWTPADNLDNANNEQPVFTAPAVTADTAQEFTLTVSDRTVNGLTATDTVTITILNLPAQPQNVQAVKGNSQVTLSWDNVSDATSYDICRASESISDASNCATLQEGAILADTSNPSVISSLNNDTTYYFVVIPKNSNGEGVASTQESATPTGAETATSTGKLNDTGITLCGDYASDTGGSGNFNNNVDCAGADPDGDPIPPGQDATHGRDSNTATNTDSDGHKGFSFTKIGADGSALANQSQSWSATGTEAAGTHWSCVKDNVTGLIWEVKTNSGLHNTNDRYNWYNTDTAINGGSAGFEDDDGNICFGYDVNDSNTYCNTQAYVARVKANGGICGATNDWRMPSVNELQSIADLSKSNPAIDTDYFPNTASNWYWSGTPYSANASYAWGVYFGNGNGGWGSRSSGGHVRLVRSGQ